MQWRDKRIVDRRRTAILFDDLLGASRRDMPCRGGSIEGDAIVRSREGIDDDLTPDRVIATRERRVSAAVVVAARTVADDIDERRPLKQCGERVLAVV